MATQLYRCAKFTRRSKHCRGCQTGADKIHTLGCLCHGFLCWQRRINVKCVPVKVKP